MSLQARHESYLSHGRRKLYLSCTSKCFLVHQIGAATLNPYVSDSWPIDRMNILIEVTQRRWSGLSGCFIKIRVVTSDFCSHGCEGCRALHAVSVDYTQQTQLGAQAWASPLHTEEFRTGSEDGGGSTIIISHTVSYFYKM